jgi:hypothetical protein
MALAHDTTILVLNPLENMIEKVNLLAKNPMAVYQAEEEELGMYGMMKQIEDKDQKKVVENLETTKLEDVINKIAQLLAVEFGEAGSKIIAENLSKNDFLNPMIMGTKIFAIFGFVIIGNSQNIFLVSQ